MNDETSRRVRILFIYPDPPGFSGQRRAAELMLVAFESVPGFELRPVKMPGLPKTGGGILAYVNFFFKTIHSLGSIVWHATFSSLDGVFIALCQTTPTLIREQWLIRMIRLFSANPELPIGFGLNGSNFTRWDGDEPVAKRFRRVLGTGKFVGVLGPSQKQVIENRFMSNHLQPIITPNTCEFDVMGVEEMIAKQMNANPLKILHLSSLMEPKGFVEIVEAVPCLSKQTEIVICGKITSTVYDRRFSGVGEAATWLRNKANELPNLTWIEGAFGEEKLRLFNEAHIFVLPTDYQVEAQPLVLLEAMARGCAIITTVVGEIAYMVDDSCAMILNSRSSAEISQAVRLLETNSELRLQLALSGRARFLDRFTMQHNRENWTSAFEAAFVTP